MPAPWPSGGGKPIFSLSSTQQAMTEATHPLPDQEPKPARLARLLFEGGAALLGVAAGVAFAEPVLAAAAATWHGYVLPAYEELIKNGMLAWCF